MPLLKAPEFANTAVIVNKFGEIRLDHALMTSSTHSVVLLEAGRGCCIIVAARDLQLLPGSRQAGRRRRPADNHRPNITLADLAA